MHRRRAYVAAILALVLALPNAAPALAATQADVNAHRAAAAAAREKAAAALALAEKLKKQTAALDQQVNTLQSAADALDPQISQASSRTDRLRGQVDALRSQIASKTATIASTQAQYDVQQQLLAQRLRETYVQGDWFYLDVLLGSSDIGDFITRTELVSRVIRSNSDAAIALASTKADLQRAKADLDHTLQDATAKRQEAAVVETGLKQLQDTRQSKVDEQQAVLDQKSQLLAENKKNAAHLLAQASAEEEESNKIAAMLKARHGSGAYHGVMAWPVPGFYHITSPFGWRVHPILHTRIFHAGIDIGKNGSQPIYGAAIVAAGKGTVIWAGARGGYGNVVMIDHGNGVVSVYAHQQNGGIKVSVGQHVAKGQRIGTVGSTGLSTGPHLHFEVRVNGTPTNPTNYL